MNARAKRTAEALFLGDNGRHPMTTKLDAATLYLGDNGRCFCGKLHCAGMTAHFTGRDLSGQEVLAVSAETARKHGLRCETCRARGAS